MKTIMMIAVAMAAALSMNVRTVDAFESVGVSSRWQAVPVNARAMAMGGAYSGVLEGPEAARWNPAVPLDGTAFAGSWNRALETDDFIGINRWSGAVSGEFRSLRLSLIRDDVTLGPMLVRTPYLPEGNGDWFEFRERVDLLSLSGDMTPVILPGRSGLVTFGLGLRRAVFSTETHTAEGEIEYEDDVEFYGLDMGVSVGRKTVGGDGPLMDWRVSAALMNGFRAAVDDHLSPAADLRLGGAWSLEQREWGGPLDSLRLLLVADWTRTVLYGDGDGPWRHNLGAELLVRNRVALRVGDAENDHSALVADGMWGVGVVLDDLSDRFDLRLDYARLSFDATEFKEEYSQDLVGVTCDLTPW